MYLTLTAEAPAFLAPGTGFVEGSFSVDGWGRWFRDDSRTLHLFLLSLHQLHLRSSSIRSWRLGTPDSQHMAGRMSYILRAQ